MLPSSSLCSLLVVESPQIAALHNSLPYATLAGQRLATTAIVDTAAAPVFPGSCDLSCQTCANSSTTGCTTCVTGADLFLNGDLTGKFRGVGPCLSAAGTSPPQGTPTHHHLRWHQLLDMMSWYYVWKCCSCSCGCHHAAVFLHQQCWAHTSALALHCAVVSVH